jgi:small subunit ribosomal protein S8e
MAQYHSKSLIKPTTGHRRAARKKKKFEIGGNWVETKLGPERKTTVRTLGGGKKTEIFATTLANVRGKDGKIVRAKITGVLEHTDNPHFVRRLTITKGCVISTDLGKVRVTSRPSQDGAVNGILLE